MPEQKPNALDQEVEQKANTIDQEIEHSDEVHQILGKVPPGIVRFGITIFCIILLIFILSAFVFKYPDIIECPITIVAENSPLSISSTVSGRIESVGISDLDSVRRGEIIAIINSTAVYDDIEKVKLLVEAVLISDDLPPAVPASAFKLGPVQQAYSVFAQQLEQLRSYVILKGDITEKRLTALNSQLAQQQQQLIRLNRQLSNQQNILRLSKKQFSRDSILFKDGVISAIEFERSQQSLLAGENTHEILKSSIASANVQVVETEYQIENISNVFIEEKSRRVTALRQSAENVRASISAWDEQFVLRSPFAGVINFPKVWKKDDYVVPGEIMFSVVPFETKHIIGRIKIPVQGSGKVHNGQRVLIAVDQFPYTEYGTINGILSNKGIIPQKNENEFFITAEVELIDGLKTEVFPALPFTQDMSGRAEIITEDITLFERLLNPIRGWTRKSRLFE